MAGKKTGKRLLTWVLVLVMALSLLPLNALAARNSTVVLHPSVGSTVTGVKVKVGDIISGYKVSSISGYDITVDLGRYNVNNDTFRLPYAKDIWNGVDNNKVDYISWAGSGSNRRSESASALLANGKNTAYYYFKGAPVLLTFTLNYDANGGIGAPASQTYKATSEYEKSHTFTIPSQAPTRDGYTFLGWNTNRSATTANYQPDGSIVVTGTTTLYAVWEENAPVDPAKPIKPSEEDIKNLLGEVTVHCTTSGNHTDKTYPLQDGSFTVGDVQGNAYPYTCTVTVEAAKYVAEYNETSFGHTLSTTDPTSKSITLTYDGTKWAAPTDTPIVFNVVCDAAPADPEVGVNFDFSENKMVVDVICETTSNHNDSYGLKNGYYTVSDKKQLANGNWQCKITIDLAKYFELYNSDSRHPDHTRDMQHPDATAIMTIYPTWFARSGKWIFVESGVTAARIYVKCDATPAEPSKEDIKELLSSNAVQIICTNDESGHGSKTFDLIDGTFTVRYNGQYTCEVKIDSFNKYVEKFNTDLGVAHISDASKTSEEKSIVNLKWEDGKWTVMDAPAEHYVLCETPKYTVTYTDGVGGEVFKDQVTSGLQKGVKTPNFDGGTPTRKGYNFTNWLPAVAETVTDNATYTAQWTKDDSQWFTVKYDANGGTGTVSDNTEYLSGTKVIVMDGDDLKKDGYEFIGWNTNANGIGTTYQKGDKFEITGNTTLYAQWKAKEYSFTVNYLWNGEAIQPPTTGEENYDTVITIPNPAIDGYTLIPGQQTSMTIGTGENVLNLNYRKNVTLTANSDTKTYDGTEHTVTGYTAKDNENKAVEGLTFTGVASPSASGTDAGEYDVEFSGSVDGAHDDLYIVTAVNSGKLTINKRSVTLTSETASKAYDGTPLTRPNVKVTGDGFVEGEVTGIKATGSVTYVSEGEVTNTIEYTPTDKFKADNYVITKHEGTLTITEASAPTPVTFDFDDVVYGDGKVTPAITKTVKGNVGKNFTETFYVTVKGADETSKDTMSAAFYTGKAEVIASKSLKDVPFLFKPEVMANAVVPYGKLRFTEAGTYTYTVREVPGGTSRMSYDTTEYTLTIEVVLNENANTYQVESWQFTAGNSKYPTPLNIVNTYRTYHPSTPSKPTLNTGDHYAYVMGYPDGMVRPNGSITRAEVSTILFRLLSDKTRDEYFTTESSFTDVKAGAWYNNSIATLEKAGVIVDTAKGGAFRPNEAITRAELAAMLAQFSDAKPVKGVKFSDVPAEHWAYEAIAIAAKMGWIEGYPDGTFRPDATITRAEMMTLVNRALERVPSDEDHLLSKRVMLTFPDCKSGDWFYIAVQEATNSHTYERAATEKNGDEQWTALRANRDWTQLEK